MNKKTVQRRMLCMSQVNNKSLSESILQNTCDLFIIIDKKGSINYINQTMNYPEISSKDLIHHSFYDFILKTDQKIVKNCVASLLKNPSLRSTFTFQSKYADKVRIWKANAQNFIDDKNINGILISLSEVTENRTIQNLIKKRDTSLKKLNKDLEKTNASLTREIKKRKKIEDELTENKEQYQLLINKANEAICVAQDGLLKFVNPKLCKMLKHTEEELLLKPFINFIHPDDRKKVLERYKKRLAGESVPEEYVFKTIDKEGLVHYVEIRAATFLWKNKPATVNFLNEVTDKLYSQQKFEKLFNTAPFLISEMDFNNLSIITANPAFEKSIGIPKEKLISISPDGIKKLFTSDDAYKERWKIAETVINENRIISFSDKRAGRYFYNIFIPMDTPQGKRHLFLIAKDITDLRFAENKYQRLIDSSPDAIAEIDGETLRAVIANPSMNDYLKISEGSVVGKDLKLILPPDLYQSRLKAALRAIREKKIQIFEDQHGGNYYQNIVVPFEVKKGKYNLQVIARDITKAKKIQQQLEENEKKFRTITTSAQDAIVIVDNKGKISLWNKAAERIFGYKEEEILGEEVHHLLMSNQYDSSMVFKGLQRFRETGKGSAVGRIQELQALKKDGTVFPVELSLSSIKLQDEWHAVGIVRDITERKKMEEDLIRSKDQLEQRVKERTFELQETLNELSESEQKYRSLVHSAPIGIAITDLKGHILDMNPAMMNLTGYSKKDIDLSKDYTSKIKLDKILHFLDKNGSLNNYEIELIKKDGRSYTALLNVEKIMYNGDPAYLAIQQDITRLKQVEKQFKEVSERLKNVIDSASEFIFTVDANKKITMWNKTAQVLTGKSASKVIGKKFFDLSFFANPQVLVDYLKNICQGYHTRETELIINSKKGKNHVFQISCSMIKGINDESTGFLIVGQDVTRGKQLRRLIINGASYLQYKTNIPKSETFLADLFNQGNSVLLVTRGSSHLLSRKTRKLPIDVLYLDEGTEQDVVTSCKDAFDRISEYCENHDSAVIILDRIDYLMMNSSFETMLQCLYHATSVINSTNSVLIIQVNPYTFSKEQLSLLKEELLLFPGSETEEVTLEESLYQLLSFIYGQNQNNVVVSYGKVGDHFGISKVTTGKRISELDRKGLISISLKGRTKSIQVTRKGKELLHKAED